MLTTWGYWQKPEDPDMLELDTTDTTGTHHVGTYRRIERLPRNLRAGDAILIGDSTDSKQYHQTVVFVVGVDTQPARTDRYRQYWSPSCTIRFRLQQRDANVWRWTSWGLTSTYRGAETKERMSVYRRVSK